MRAPLARVSHPTGAITKKLICEYSVGGIKGCSTRTKVIVFTFFSPFRNVIFPAQAEYSGFSVNFKLTIVLRYSYFISYDISVLDIKTAIGCQLFSGRFLRFVG